VILSSLFFDTYWREVERNFVFVYRFPHFLFSTLPIRAIQTPGQRNASRGGQSANDHSGGGLCLARQPFVGRTDKVFAVTPFELSHHEVSPRNILKVVNECVVHRRTA
jgi:hypothetical protein